MRWIVVAIFVAGIAHADPFPETLTKAQIDAASNAAVAALPRVDTVASAACSETDVAKRLQAGTDTADDIGAMAACFHRAGSLGLAIQLWKRVADVYPNRSRDAVRELGTAYERAGHYADAARWHEQYAQKYGGEKDAADHYVRAVCIWRQLGVDKAIGGFKSLQRMWPKQYAKTDAVALCEKIRPIVPPKPP